MLRGLYPRSGGLCPMLAGLCPMLGGLSPWSGGLPHSMSGLTKTATVLSLLTLHVPTPPWGFLPKHTRLDTITKIAKTYKCVSEPLTFIAVTVLCLHLVNQTNRVKPDASWTLYCLGCGYTLFQCQTTYL